MGKYAKFGLKVRSKSKLGWAHLAYVPPELKKEFQSCVRNTGWTINDFVDKWAKQDFGSKRIDTWDHLEELRNAIKDKYRKIYPELHEGVNDEIIDVKGWTRIWVMGKMKEEIACRKKAI